VKGRAMRLLKSGVFLLASLTLWLGLNPLGVQSAPKSSRAPATQGQLTLLCFDKDFDSERDATVWSMEVRASLQANVDHYLMQRTKSNGRKFVVCLGPLKNTKEAEKKRSTLSDAMQTPLFTVPSAILPQGPAQAELTTTSADKTVLRKLAPAPR